MKQLSMKTIFLSFLIGGFSASAIAQKDVKKEVKEVQQIIITRTGDKDEKTVIEVKGDKVTVNGKDLKDLKEGEVNVSIQKMRDGNIAFFRNGENFNFNFNESPSALFSLDSNRAMLGVVTADDDAGAKIQSVSKQSAAEKAGLKKDDVITKIDGSKVSNPDDVTKAIRSKKPGDKVSMEVLRDGKTQKLTAELGRWKGINMAAMAMPRILDRDIWKEGVEHNIERAFENFPGRGAVQVHGLSRPRLGMSIQDTDDSKGVKVIDVENDGNAAKAGIQENDIITKVDDKEVNSADAIAKLIREKKDQPLMSFQVLRNGKTVTVEVKNPKKIKTIDL